MILNRPDSRFETLYGIYYNSNRVIERVPDHHTLSQLAPVSDYSERKCALMGEVK